MSQNKIVYKKLERQQEQKVILKDIVPMKIAVEFDREVFSSLGQIKKWMISNCLKFGLKIDFEADSMQKTDEQWSFQIGNVFSDPLCEQRVSLDGGVQVVYHFVLLKIKNEKKIEELQQYQKNL